MNTPSFDTVTQLQAIVMQRVERFEKAGDGHQLLGVRNTFIANYNPLQLRQDTGALRENFLIGERLQTLAYSRAHSNSWFWRTHSQQEIDYFEERAGRI